MRELQSLIDYQDYNPVLPTGHPFSGVQSNAYWSSTTKVNGPGVAWLVNLGFGGVVLGVKTLTVYVWPVRGGQ